MSDDFDDYDGIIVDDDPALDYILYEEMTREDNDRRNKGGGCLGAVALLAPFAAATLWLAKLAIS